MFVKTEDLAKVLEEYVSRYELTHIGTTNRINWKELERTGVPSAREYIAEKCGVSSKCVQHILTKRTNATSFRNADKILCGLGMNFLFQSDVPVYSVRPD